jgi:acyl phosphate:glycerol-3-phosphate acyltransferase
MAFGLSESLAWYLVAAGAVIGYFVGGIPWALIVGKRFYGIDLRKCGSGNLGATNVFRVLGARAGIIVALLDASKGALSVVIATLLVPHSVSPAVHGWAVVSATGGAMLGHSYSPYIKFAGGKGVAVAAGALLVMTPKAWPILFVVWFLTILLTRYVSLGSISAAVAFPIAVLLLYRDVLAVVLFAFAAASLVVWRHRSNIGRLVRGEESKIDLRNARNRAREMASEARSSSAAGSSDGDKDGGR